TQKYFLLTAGVILIGLLAFGYETVLSAGTAIADGYAVLTGDANPPGAVLADIDRLRQPIQETVTSRLDELIPAPEGKATNPGVKVLTDAWETSQVSAATVETAKGRLAEIRAFYAASMDRSCECWSPIEGGQHAVATSWILISHAELGIAVEPAVLTK